MGQTGQRIDGYHESGERRICGKFVKRRRVGPCVGMRQWRWTRRGTSWAAPVPCLRTRAASPLQICKQPIAIRSSSHGLRRLVRFQSFLTAPLPHDFYCLFFFKRKREERERALGLGFCAGKDGWIGHRFHLPRRIDLHL